MRELLKLSKSRNVVNDLVPHCLLDRFAEFRRLWAFNEFGTLVRPIRYRKGKSAEKRSPRNPVGRASAKHQAVAALRPDSIFNPGRQPIERYGRVADPDRLLRPAARSQTSLH